jgi:hypothetical protein
MPSPGMFPSEAASSHNCGGICKEICQVSVTVLAGAGEAKPAVHPSASVPTTRPRRTLIIVRLYPGPERADMDRTYD